MLIASIVALTLAYLSVSLGIQQILKLIGQPLQLSLVAKAYALSQPAKYIPGGIWHLPGRVILYRRYGVPTLAGSAALFWELTTTSLAAAILGILASGRGLTDTHLLPVVTAIGLAALISCLAVLFLPIASLSEWLSHRQIRLPVPVTVATSRRSRGERAYHWVLALGGFMFSWTLTGVAFWIMVLSVVAGAASPIALVGIFSAGWVIGFVTVFAPGGVGIREIVLALLLAGIFPEPYPVVIAAMSRIWWTLAEVIVVLIGLSIPIPMDKAPAAPPVADRP